MKKTYYYKTFEDDIVESKNQNYKLKENYKWVKNNIWYKINDKEFHIKSHDYNESSYGLFYRKMRNDS